jgi:hypothetical protein
MPRIYEPVFLANYVRDKSIVHTPYKNRNVGQGFWGMLPGAEIHGARVYTHQTGSQQLEVQLWLPGQVAGPTTPEKTQTFNVPDQGIYDLFWDTPYIVTYSILSKQYDTVWDQFIIGLGPNAVGHTLSTSETETDLFQSWRANEGWSIIYMGNTFYRYNGAYEATGRPVTGGAGILAIDPLVLPPDNMLYEPTPAVHCMGPGPKTHDLRNEDWTVGCRAHAMTPGLFYGVRFYTAYTGTQNMKCSIWDPENVFVTSKTIETTAAGTYDALFDTPVRVLQSDIYTTTKPWYFGVYSDQSYITSINNQTWMNSASRKYGFSMLNYEPSQSGNAHSIHYAVGDALPNSSENREYPVAPLAWADNLVTP